jgi:hypothetical protein
VTISAKLARVAAAFSVRITKADNFRLWPQRVSYCLGGLHRGDGNCFVVGADEKLTAFVELEAAIHAYRELI